MIAATRPSYTEEDLQWARSLGNPSWTAILDRWLADGTMHKNAEGRYVIDD